MFQLTVRHAVTVDDVRRALLDDDFQMVHFSGHGTENGLVLEDHSGRLHVPPMRAVADLLAEYSPPLECVLLNACYSVSQGRFTSMSVPFTIGMDRPISDMAAIAFGAAFYDSLGAGKGIEFSFRQGVHALRLAGHPDGAVPVLLRKGESITPLVAETPPPTAARHVDQLLVGIALDVSGSMETNIPSAAGPEQSRFQAFSQAFAESLNRAQRIVRSADGDPRVSIFAYAFGLRAGSVADLFTLLKASRDVVDEKEVRRLGERHAADLRSRYSGYSDLEGLARSYGFGGLVDSVKADAETRGREEVARLVVNDLLPKIQKRMDTIGDTTLGLRELADLWKPTATSEAAEAVIFGDTPMCAALKSVSERFQREAKRSGASQRLLLLISDGNPTDGDPEPIAERIRAQGVVVISCFISAADVQSPRQLVVRPDLRWPSDATRLFRMASTVDLQSPVTAHLLRNGWTIENGSRYFFQANHSELLAEFVETAFSPMEGRGLLPKGQ
jgi:hypothetical protein